jgi:hypothetical protein
MKRVSVITSALALMLALAVIHACTPMQAVSIPTDPVEALKQAQAYIDESNTLLIAVASVVRQQKVEGIITPAERDQYVAHMRDFASKVDIAQGLVDTCTESKGPCDFTKAWNQGRLLRQGVTIIHREIAARARGR